MSPRIPGPLKNDSNLRFYEVYMKICTTWTLGQLEQNVWRPHAPWLSEMNLFRGHLFLFQSTGKI